jgi:hypothetical protein
MSLSLDIDVCMIQMKFCKVIEYKYMIIKSSQICINALTGSFQIIRNIIPDLHAENQYFGVINPILYTTSIQISGIITILSPYITTKLRNHFSVHVSS